MYIYFVKKKNQSIKSTNKQRKEVNEVNSQYGNANGDWETVTMEVDVPVLFLRIGEHRSLWFGALKAPLIIIGPLGVNITVPSAVSATYTNLVFTWRDRKRPVRPTDSHRPPPPTPARVESSGGRHWGEPSSLTSAALPSLALAASLGPLWRVEVPTERVKVLLYVNEKSSTLPRSHLASPDTPSFPKWEGRK